MIAVNPPVEIDEPKMLCMILGMFCKILGTNCTPKPSPRDTARIRKERLSSFDLDIIFIPAAATVPNIIRLAAPITGFGINLNIPPTIGNNPNRKRKIATIIPTYLLATPVSWITPLF